MIQSNISMPNPVLGITGDFKTGSFEISCTVKINSTDRVYEIDITNVIISNSYIESLYKDNKFDLVLKISCIPTYKTWSFINQTKMILPESEIDSLLEIESFLIANSKIDHYSSDTFSDDFDNQVFQLELGDITAITGVQKIPIQKENEKVSVGSIFRFSKIDSNAESQELNFDFDSDQIIIYYPTNQEFDPVTFLFDKIQGLPYTALSLYIIPSLVEAFRIMDDKEELSFKDKKWYVVLDSLLPKTKRDEDCFVNAQRVIQTGIPILKSFNEILALKNIWQ